MSAQASITWLKLPIIAETIVVLEDFKVEFGPCKADARWMVGDGMLLCQSHAEVVAREFGDDIGEIESAWRAQL